MRLEKASMKDALEKYVKAWNSKKEVTIKDLPSKQLSRIMMLEDSYKSLVDERRAFKWKARKVISWYESERTKKTLSIFLNKVLEW